MRPTVHLRHPDLDRVIDVPDDPDSVAVLAESGWVRYEPPSSSHPALVEGEPGPDEEPKTPKARGRNKPDDVD